MALLSNTRTNFKLLNKNIRIKKMSTNPLPPQPIRDLLLNVMQEEPHYGKSEKEKAEVSQWLEKVTEGHIFNPSAIKDLNNLITPRTYLVGNELTAADIALYGGLHTTFSQLQPSEYYAHPALTRYFDHIQMHPATRKAANKMTPAFAVIKIDPESMPPLERKTDAPKKKSTTLSEILKPNSEENLTKQEEKKKERNKVGNSADVTKKTTSGGGGKTPAAEDTGDPLPSMIDLRVGHIVDVKKHPDADGLYIEQIDIGDESGPRTVVSGLVHYIPIEEMRDKYLIAVCNLKPANMRGVKSFAMVLAATHKDGKEAGIELIQPPPGAKPGDRVYFEGPAYENAQPLSQLNPKKKIFETIQPGFTTLDTREAAWINPITKSTHRIRTQGGYCIAPTIIGGTLS